MRHQERVRFFMPACFRSVSVIPSFSVAFQRDKTVLLAGVTVHQPKLTVCNWVRFRSCSKLRSDTCVISKPATNAPSGKS